MGQEIRVSVCHKNSGGETDLDKISVVENMQKYLEQYGKEESFSMERLYNSVGYTKRHADRLFREFLHMTPAEYLRAVRLSQSARELVETDKSVLEVALDHHYATHEGYTRAFEGQFSANASSLPKGKKADSAFYAQSCEPLLYFTEPKGENGHEEKNHPLYHQCG